MLGIDRMGVMYYEGESPLEGRAVWPSPVVSIACRVKGDSGKAPVGETLQKAQLVFREDTFEPISRVRRGRFYYRTGGEFLGWGVSSHPMAITEVGFKSKHLYSFQAQPPDGKTPDILGSVFAFGSGSMVSHWRAVDVERITSGEDLVTLKALSRYGVLPELDESKLPEGSRRQITEFYDKAADAAYRFGPESVVDRCRDGATALLGTWLTTETQDATKAHLDLAKLADAAHERKKHAVGAAGRLMALLHARGKPSEQARRGVAGPTEADSAVALECLGFIARELGYASG